METEAHVDKVHSVSTKTNPSSTPKSSNLKWVNNGYKSVRAMENIRWPLDFSSLPDKLHFYLMG